MDDENNHKQLTQEEVKLFQGPIGFLSNETNENSLFSILFSPLFERTQARKEERKKNGISLTFLKENLRFLVFKFPSKKISFFIFYVDPIASFEKIRCKYCFLD